MSVLADLRINVINVISSVVSEVCNDKQTRAELIPWGPIWSGEAETPSFDTNTANSRFGINRVDK